MQKEVNSHLHLCGHVTETYKVVPNCRTPGTASFFPGREGPKFFYLHFKVQPDSNHVAKFHDDRQGAWRSRGKKNN